MIAVKLRNGTEEAKALVQVVFMHINHLWEQGLGGVLTVYDLREVCRGNAAVVSDTNMATLKRLELVGEDGRVHQSIRNIVESALKGEGIETELVSPIVKEGPSE